MGGGLKFTLRSGWVIFARGYVTHAIFLPFLFLHKINVCEHDGFFVGVVVFGFGLGTGLVGLVDNLPHTGAVRVGTATHDVDATLRGVGDDFSDIGSPPDAATSQFLTGSGGERTSFLGGSSGSSLGFVHGDPPCGSSQLAAFGEEPFASIALSEQGLVFISQLIPEVVESFVMRAVDIVAEFMQHCIDHLLEWQELSFVTGIA